MALICSAVGLAAMTVPSNAKRCTVTVINTDQTGTPIANTAHTRLCRPGETNGGTEIYNPYTHAYVFHPYYPPVTNPLTGQPTPVPGSYAGSDNSSVTTPPCTPQKRGPKGARLPLQAGQHACPSSSSGTPAQ
jgi:hypothetical protein